MAHGGTTMAADAKLRDTAGASSLVMTQRAVGVVALGT